MSQFREKLLKLKKYNSITDLIFLIKHLKNRKLLFFSFFLHNFQLQFYFNEKSYCFVLENQQQHSIRKTTKKNYCQLFASVTATSCSSNLPPVDYKPVFFSFFVVSFFLTKHVNKKMYSGQTANLKRCKNKDKR